VIGDGVVTGFGPHDAIFVSTSFSWRPAMKQIAVALLTAATFAAAPALPAQSCGLLGYDICASLFPEAGWLPLAIRGYCSVAMVVLCDAGF
jgi:hypothetical protein